MRELQTPSIRRSYAHVLKQLDTAAIAAVPAASLAICASMPTPDEEACGAVQHSLSLKHHSLSLSRFRIRCLMLHGRAGNARLVNSLMQGMQWLDGLSDLVEFDFVDAPHQCAPRPELYRALAQRGLYGA